jgi:hypothetical protein
MATLKEAIENASAFAREALGSLRTQGLRLEEVESGLAAWQITLSMVAVPDESPGGIVAALSALNPTRVYKVFTVQKDTGESQP